MWRVSKSPKTPMGERPARNFGRASEQRPASPLTGDGTLEKPLQVPMFTPSERGKYAASEGLPGLVCGTPLKAEVL